MIGKWVERSCLAIPVMRRGYLNHYARIKWFEKQLQLAIGFPSPPSTVVLLVTYACNFVCDHCVTTSHPRAEWGLPFETISRLIREMAEMRVRHLWISGGEPLVRDDLFDIIDLAKGWGL